MCCLWVLQVQSTHSATYILIFSECCECLPRTSNRQHRGRIKPVNLCLYVICALIESPIICNSSITAVSLQSNDLLVYCCESHFLDPWDICYVKKKKPQQYLKLQLPLIALTVLFANSQSLNCLHLTKWKTITQN